MCSLSVSKMTTISRNYTRLMQINPSVLMDISQQMAAGEIVRPESDGRKLCFSLIDDLDHVGGHVKGSLTSKKYAK